MVVRPSEVLLLLEPEPLAADERKLIAVKLKMLTAN